MGLTNEDRARIARGWRDSGLSQAEYAAMHGITDRALRSWSARWARPSPVSAAGLTEEVNRIIAEVRVLLAEVVKLAPALGPEFHREQVHTPRPYGGPTMPRSLDLSNITGGT